MERLSRSWMVGGIGLIAAGVSENIGYALAATGGVLVMNVIGELFFAAAVLVFAFGLTREASVVARGPLGVTAMVIVALWPLASSATAQALAPQAEGSPDGLIVFGYVSILIPVAAGLIAAIEIARAGVVPSPWRWAPLWVLAVQVVAWVIPQLIQVAVGPDAMAQYVGLFTVPGVVGAMAATFGLGILAVVLAERMRHAVSADVPAVGATPS
jgi:hypothetical protein